MKRVMGICVLVAALGISGISKAQSKMEASVSDVKKETRKAGAKASELVAKSNSRMNGQLYKDMTGPNGEVIYMDRHAKYFWVDEKGNRHYVDREQLKEKEKQDDDWLKDGMRYI